MRSLTKENWIALRGKRAEITSALQALGIPIIAWVNEFPEFRAGYKPDWEQIERIATTLQTKGVDQWPGPYKEPVKVPVKAKALKKVVKGAVKNGKK